MLKPTKKINPGFTVLEVMIAVSIIALLAALLIYGLGFMTSSAKNRQTKIMLGDARGMLQEYDTATGFSRSVPAWPWIELTTQGTLPSGSIIPVFGNNMWTSSYSYSYTTASGSTFTASEPLCVPWVLLTSDPTYFQNRNGWYAVLYTQLAMRMIGGIDAAKSMLGKIPTGNTMLPIFVKGAPYVAGNVVKSPRDNQYYRLTNAVWTGIPPIPYTSPFSSPYTNDPSSDIHWTRLTANESPDPILLDAWGNPILMAPAAGLIGVWTNCSKGNGPINPPPEWGGSPTTPTTQLQAWANPIPTGQTQQTYMQKPITAPDNKPFFISAGPDGDFSTGDDNIYSFD